MKTPRVKLKAVGEPTLQKDCSHLSDYTGVTCLPGLIHTGSVYDQELVEGLETTLEALVYCYSQMKSDGEKFQSDVSPRSVCEVVVLNFG